MSFNIQLSSSTGVPFYRQIINQVQYAAVNGIIGSQEQLPTVRKLAVELAVNLNTVVKAYKELEKLGIVESQQGTGSFIAAKLPRMNEQEKSTRLKAVSTVYLDELAALGVDLDRGIKTAKQIHKERKNG